jgi:predicted GNAT superfamily acetyltransferase
MSAAGRPDVADLEAAAAAQAAGVRIRELTGIADLDAACALFDEIWHPDPGSRPMTSELMRALIKAGNYVAGAFDDGAGNDRLVGAAVGFFGPPADKVLHSHIAGVSAATAGRGVGYALKLHQRAWARCRDVTRMTWTFDPLVRRNAYFNLIKLGAWPAEYLIDFYGGMHDAINAGDDTDRLLVCWELGAPGSAPTRPGKTDAEAERARGAREVLCSTPDGWPRSPTTGPRTAEAENATTIPERRRVLVAVPPDIEALRVSDPACAVAWRSALRQALAPLLAGGGRVTGFDKAGWYVVDSEEETQ